MMRLQMTATVPHCIDTVHMFHVSTLHCIIQYWITFVFATFEMQMRKRSSRFIWTLDIIHKKSMRRRQGGKGGGGSVILGSPQKGAGFHGFRVVVAGVAGPMGGRQLVA